MRHPRVGASFPIVSQCIDSERTNLLTAVTAKSCCHAGQLVLSDRLAATEKVWKHQGFFCRKHYRESIVVFSLSLRANDHDCHRGWC